MKLASYKDGSRDGQLVVVSRDLASAHYATGIATRMQQVLDDWSFLSPQLEDLSQALDHGRARHAFAFDPAQCMAPLPRAFQWLDGSAYLSHYQRLCVARGEPDPPWLDSDPLLYQGAGDDMLGATDDAWFGSERWGIDCEGELAVVTDDVEMGASPEQGLDAVRLLLLANDWSLRELIPPELAKGFGFVHGKPATAFAPVAVTPDDLGDAWQQGRLHARLRVALNGQRSAEIDTAAGMHFHFGQLIAHASKTRRLRAGSIVGGGTISVADAAQGVACRAEQRALEAAADGQPRTPWLRFGDRVGLDVVDRDGNSLFGAIDQAVTGPQAAMPVDEAAASDRADTGDTGDTHPAT